MTPLVLAFALSDARAARIKTMCLVQKLRFCLVPPVQYGVPVGELAALSPMSPPAYAAGDIDEEMLILCAFSEPALDAFITGFRKSGTPPVSLKAVLTTTNASWPATALYAEIKKERAVMTGAR